MVLGNVLHEKRLQRYENVGSLAAGHERRALGVPLVNPPRDRRDL